MKGAEKPTKKMKVRDPKLFQKLKRAEGVPDMILRPRKEEGGLGEDGGGHAV